MDEAMNASQEYEYFKYRRMSSVSNQIQFPSYNL
jgi:hypothetical protein